VVYGDLLVPYLSTLLESQDGSTLVHSIFDFLEALLLSRDAKIRDLVGASVLEPLNQPPELRWKARKHMGPMTRGLAEQIEEAWGS
jgi:hypothetical protein